MLQEPPGELFWTDRAEWERRCLASRFRLVKTVRMDLDFVRTSLDLEVKVIHLVRDPRGIRYSLWKHPSEWPEATLNASRICDRLRRDAAAARLLSADFPYLRVRYEDLVRHLETELEIVYDFASVPKTCQAQERIRALTGTDFEFRGNCSAAADGATIRPVPDSPRDPFAVRESLSQYYSPKRDLKRLDPNAFRLYGTERDVERLCSDVLSAYNYGLER